MTWMTWMTQMTWMTGWQEASQTIDRMVYFNKQLLLVSILSTYLCACGFCFIPDFLHSALNLLTQLLTGQAAVMWHVWSLCLDEYSVYRVHILCTVYLICYLHRCNVSTTMKATSSKIIVSKSCDWPHTFDMICSCKKEYYLVVEICFHFIQTCSFH